MCIQSPAGRGEDLDGELRGVLQRFLFLPCADRARSSDGKSGPLPKGRSPVRIWSGATHARFSVAAVAHLRERPIFNWGKRGGRPGARPLPFSNPLLANSIP